METQAPHYPFDKLQGKQSKGSQSNNSRGTEGQTHLGIAVKLHNQSSDRSFPMLWLLIELCKHDMWCCVPQESHATPFGHMCKV